MQQNVRLQSELSRLQASQFIFGLNPLTIVSIDVASLAIGKTGNTFRQDLFRRPESLPRTVRRGGRVFVQVSDLLDFLKNGNAQQQSSAGKKRGRPTKSEQVARRVKNGDTDVPPEPTPSPDDRWGKNRQFFVGLGINTFIPVRDLEKMKGLDISGINPELVVRKSKRLGVRVGDLVEWMDGGAT
jgi:hypothetical protein